MYLTNNKPVVWFKSAIAIGNISNSNSLQQTVKTLETLPFRKNYTEALLTTEREEYGKREKVIVKVKFQGSSGTPTQSLFSVGIAFNTR